MITLSRKKKTSSGLSITPLIDVIFLLLLFFMLTSSFMSKPGIKITLPRAVTAKPEKEHKITVYIDDDSSLYLNDTHITYEELEKSLISLLANSKVKNVITIKSDQNAPFGKVVYVIDTAKKINSEAVILSTDPPEKMP